MSEVKMVYEVSIDMPGRPEGAPVQIPGLGTFENGSSYEVSEQEAAAYRSFHTRQVIKLGTDGEILGSDVELGPSLADASETMHGVTVEEIDKTVQADDEEVSGDPDNNVAVDGASESPVVTTTTTDSEGSVE